MGPERSWLSVRRHYSTRTCAFSRVRLVAQLAVEALDLAVSPGAAGLDDERWRADPLQPGAHHAVRLTVQLVVGPDVPRDLDGVTLAGVFVAHGEQAQRSAVVRPSGHQVAGPDVVPPPPFRLAAGHLQPFPAPEPLLPLGVHPPALGPQQRCAAAIAVAPKARGLPLNRGREGGLRRGDHRAVPLRFPFLVPPSH